jgi:predicted site-specific integrase-resolvase
MSTEVKRRAETLREFAESFGVSYDTMWRYSLDGTLKTIQMGNRKVVPLSEIERVSREGLTP